MSKPSVTERGPWHEVLNRDARDYGASRLGNLGEVEAGPFSLNHHHCSLNLNLPTPLVRFFKSGGQEQ
jgi:1,4-alpha-glucan branching enzyme